MNTQKNIDKSVFEVLVEDHKQRFNGGYAYVKFAALGQDTVFFTTTLYAPEFWPNNIAQNDPMKEHIMIEKVGDDDYVATLDGGRITIWPRPEDKYMAYSSVKCGFRKTKGNAEKIIKSILKWQQKRLELVKELKSEIPHIEKSNLKDI
jgi:hypothetical protein